MFYYVFGYNHLREIDKRGSGTTDQLCSADSRIRCWQIQNYAVNFSTSFSLNHIQRRSRYLAHSSPETAQISICFRLSGTFAMMVLNRRNGRFLSLLYLFRLSCIFERTSEQQPTFRIAKRKSREKKCRTQIEQSEHSANRINHIVKGIDDFVRLFAGF